MPAFTAYHLPIYRHRAYTAATLEEACRLAVEDDDWRFERRDYDCAGETHVTGAWRGVDMAYRRNALPVPGQFDERIQRKADHFASLLALLAQCAAPDDAPARTAIDSAASEDLESQEGDSGAGAELGDGQASAGDSEEDEAGRRKPIPDRLVQELTACRTVALRNALAQDFDTAFLAVLHAMCLELFYQYAPHSCLQIKANSHFPAHAPGIADIIAAKAVEKRHKLWAADLPSDPRALWNALVDFSRKGKYVALFAHCASLTINAVREPHQPRREALRHADSLAAALSLASMLSRRRNSRTLWPISTVAERVRTASEHRLMRTYDGRKWVPQPLPSGTWPRLVAGRRRRLSTAPQGGHRRRQGSAGSLARPLPPLHRRFGHIGSVAPCSG